MWYYLNAHFHGQRVKILQALVYILPIVDKLYGIHNAICSFVSADPFVTNPVTSTAGHYKIKFYLLVRVYQLWYMTTW